jgi:hypothetical protein
MKKAVTAVCAILLFGNWTIGAAEAQAAGIVKAVKGRAVISRNGQSLEAADGMKLLRGDVIQTSETASIGLIFDDDTVVSMGPASEMLIEEYDFVPIEGKLSFVARFIRGTIAYLSGQISKLSPAAVRLETPVATIGVRGTQVLIKLER